MPIHTLPRDPEPYRRLKAILEARNLTAADLATAIGLSRASIYRSLAKSSGLEPYWVTISRRLNVSLDWLLAGKASAAPVEFVDTSGQAALQDTETLSSGRIIGSLSTSSEKWPESSNTAYSVARGRWGLRVVEPMTIQLKPGDVLVLETPFDEHLGDSRSMIESGDIAAIQGNDGSFSVGRVQKESKRGWFALTDNDGKITIWTDGDIHQAHRVNGIEIAPRLYDIA